MHTGIPICELFSNHRPFTYGDPHMHTAIPVCKITHMGIQDLISHMEIFPVCIRLVTEISPYAYGDCVNPCMHTGISVNEIPECIRGFARPCMHTGIDLDPSMHMGITCHVIPISILCILIAWQAATLTMIAMVRRAMKLMTIVTV